MPAVANTVVFLGPSLGLDLARRRLDAEFRAPATRGDVYGLLGTAVRRIILIDGLFHGTPSVWHRELIAALDEGIEIYGASSMGALRGVELAAHGMIGHGTVFGWYRDGAIDGDDEVALLHGAADAGYRALSEPLVNLRATLAKAVEDGVLGEDERRRLVDEARRTFYPHRSVRTLMTGAVARTWSVARRDAVFDALQRGHVDIKRRDAEGVLDHCRVAPIQHPRAMAAGAVELDHASYERVRAREIAPGLTGEALVERARASGVARELRPRLALRWYAMAWAQARGVTCPPEERDLLQRRHQAEIATSDVPRWLCEQRVTLREYERWIEARALAEWLARERAPLEALARDWLASWGIVEPHLPDPVDLGFTWPVVHDLMIELILTGAAA